jgi:hypothetical protein
MTCDWYEGSYQQHSEWKTTPVDNETTLEDEDLEFID